MDGDGLGKQSTRVRSLKQGLHLMQIDAPPKPRVTAGLIVRGAALEVSLTTSRNSLLAGVNLYAGTSRLSYSRIARETVATVTDPFANQRPRHTWNHLSNIPEAFTHVFG